MFHEGGEKKKKKRNWKTYHRRPTHTDKTTNLARERTEKEYERDEKRGNN